MVDPATLISIVRPLIERAQPEWKKSQKALQRRFGEEVPRGIADHHVYVSSWCREFHSGLLAAVELAAPA